MKGLFFYAIAMFAVLVGVGKAVCYAASTEADRCEQASRHVEVCTGVYYTPPKCDHTRALLSRALLATPCDSLELRIAHETRDGALCNWFGVGCVPDPAIFHGPACDSTADCAANATCMEGRCFHGVDSQEFSETLDTITGAQERQDGSAYVLYDNVEVREIWQELIDSAQDTIHLISLYFEADEIAEDIAQRLASAASRGVQVRLIYDHAGQFLYDTTRTLKPLPELGVMVHAFNPLFDWPVGSSSTEVSVNQRIHEKVLVVDSQVAVTGGRNVGASYMGWNGWHDTDVLLRGPAVSDFQWLFLQDWDEFLGWEETAGCPQKERWGYYCPAEWEQPLAREERFFPRQPRAGDALVRVVHSNPRYEHGAVGYETTLTLIRAARQSLLITNAYLVPPKRLRTHLIAAARRGVDVRVITNSRESNDVPVMWYAAANFYEELIRGGVEVYEWGGTQTHHAKTMIVDEQMAVIGSYNFDPRSADTNSEVMALIRDPDAVAQLRALFAADLEDSVLAGYDFSWSDRLLMEAHRIVEPLL